MKKITLSLLMLCGLAFSLSGQDIAGKWYGTLKIGSTELRLIFDITPTEGGYTSLMDSPDQGAKGIPITSTTYADGKLKLSANNLGIIYEAALQQDNLEGTFSQSGTSIPLKMGREEIKARRPQTPPKPFPYKSEDVCFDNAKAGITLAGTLTIPHGKGKFPAVVLISGSGAQNRDEELFEHKPFLVLADYLTRNGIAVLRYDDRGVGESGGDYHTCSMYDFADDALSAARYLASRPEIDRKKIGMAGHSEGGAIVYILAGGEGKKDIAFIVSMAGPAVKGSLLLDEQQRLILKALGFPQEYYLKNKEIFEATIAVAEKYPAEYILANIDSIAESIIPATMPKDEATKNMFIAGLRQASSKEILSIYQFDPDKYISAVTCPILAVGGTLDLQVPPSMSLDIVKEKALSAKSTTVKKYDNLNHLFQHTETGLPTEYATIEETISPEVISDIAAWILSVTK